MEIWMETSFLLKNEKKFFSFKSFFAYVKTETKKVVRKEQSTYSFRFPYNNKINSHLTNNQRAPPWQRAEKRS